MKTWNVAIPITGKIYLTLELEDDSTEDDAIEAALNSEYDLDDVEEWESHKQITRGNFFFGMMNEAYAEEEE